MSETEQELADQLKQECYENGKEKNPKSSAKLLHKLGIVYRSKSPDRQSLIQSAALMTSAIIREPNNVDVIKQDTTELLSHLLQLAQAKCGPKVIRNAVVDIKSQVKDLRKATEEKLEAIKPIPDDAINEDWKRAQKQKIKDVERLQEFVTETYADIMSSVCKHSSKVMGDAPCKFTLVGMGSIARKEITPYSDFESIMVLEEGAQHADDYDDILEYFRWFSTIFQIILIQLGETPLRFLAIPCLNDPLNSQNSWFYDEFTPCGICPDGLAPHACKNPLGRQMPTLSKPWTTELIKPVSEMLKYLDSDEDIKNGYHLADILMKTCYVAGCEDVYQVFSSTVQKNLEKQFSKNQKEYFEATALQIKEDIERYRETFHNSSNAMFLDVKRVLYRVPTLFVSNLGRLYNLKETSCLDILDKLCTLNVMTESDSFKLKFAVSVACEVRLRSYTSSQSQSDLVPQVYVVDEKVKDIQPIVDKIGAKAVVSCYTSAILLEQSLPLDLLLSKFYKVRPIFLLPEKKWMHVDNCANLRLYDYGMKACQELLYQSESLQLLERLQVYMTYAQCLYNVRRESEAAKVLKEQMTTASELTKNLNVASAECLKRYHFELGSISFATGKYKYGLKCFRKVKFLVSKFPESVSYKNGLLINMGKCYAQMKHYVKALRCFKKVALEEKNLVQNQVYLEVLYQRALCLRELLRFDEAKSCLERIIECRKMSVGEDEFDWWILTCLYELAECLIGLNKFEEALDVCEKAWRKERLQHKSRDMYLDLKSYCLIKLRRGQEALPVLEEYLKLLKSSNYQKSAQFSKANGKVAGCLKDLALCTCVLGLYEKSARYSQEAIELHQDKQQGKQLDKNLIATMLRVNMISKEKLLLSPYKTRSASLENVSEANFRSSKEECFKQSRDALTKLVALASKRKSKESLFEFLSHNFTPDRYHLLLANFMRNMKQDGGGLIQYRQAWCETSRLNWSSDSVYQKCVALHGLTISCVSNRRRECLEVSEYYLDLAQQFLINSVQVAGFSHFELYMWCRLCHFIDCSSLPYSYTPSIYHHVLHLLIDNPDICCYEWRDICLEFFKEIRQNCNRRT